ncbi:MAG: succinate dehydrogenase cytochrome b subunit [Gemmatimonadota bacterium]|jgi:succinate dehydrogenase / fumarate reductase cytochrome b subunit
MRRVVSLFRSSVGKKILMALTGVILVGFIVAHMFGNLKVFYGPEAFDHYAEWLRDPLSPLVPPMWGLWIFRIVLLGAVAVHIWAALSTWLTSRAARRHGYRKEKSLSFSYASRTMRWGGVIVFLFVVYHILHFTTGQAHSDFRQGEVYHNFVVAFRHPLVLLAYLVAQGALCLHIYHGVWSVFQTLGANHPRYNAYRRPLAAVVALLVFAGFMAPPVAVSAGLIGQEVPMQAATGPSDRSLALDPAARQAPVPDAPEGSH